MADDEQDRLDDVLRAITERFPPGYEGLISHPDFTQGELEKRAWEKYNREHRPH